MELVTLYASQPGLVGALIHGHIHSQDPHREHRGTRLEMCAQQPSPDSQPSCRA